MAAIPAATEAAMAWLLAMIDTLATYAQAHPFASAAVAAIVSAWTLHAPERPF